MLTRRSLVHVGTFAGVATLSSAAAWWWWPASGGVLGQRDRDRLLDQAGLPHAFPLHPQARRMAQPPKGGISYAVREPVPDVHAWLRFALMQSGYQVISGDLPGQDDFTTHWLHFRGREASGSVIVREHGRGPTADTEVKILSFADERLAAATRPADPSR